MTLALFDSALLTLYVGVLDAIAAHWLTRFD